MLAIKKDGRVLAKLITGEEWKDGLSFFSDNEDYIQVGTWSYASGKELLAHVHNEVERTVLRTQEVLYIRKGKIEAKIYDLDGNLFKTLLVQEGDTLILLNSGDGYTIIEDGTEVLEIKNGPYLGPEIDRKRI